MTKRLLSDNSQYTKSNKEVENLFLKKVSKFLIKDI